jgi:hypothetical protein
MAPETKIDVTCDEELSIDGAVGLMTRCTAFAKGLMFVHEGSGLFFVALKTELVLPPEADPRGQHNVFSVQIVATAAAHVPFSKGMVELEVELRLFFQMALITDCRIIPRIDDKFSAPPSRLYVKTGGAMAGFTAQDLSTIFQGNGITSMKRFLETFKVFISDCFMTPCTSFHTNVFSARNGKRRSHHHALLHIGARKEENQNRKNDKSRSSQHYPMLFHVLSPPMNWLKNKQVQTL